MDEDTYRPIRTPVPDPPPYEPHAADPVEAAAIAELERRGDRQPGEIIE